MRLRLRQPSFVGDKGGPPGRPHDSRSRSPPYACSPRPRRGASPRSWPTRRAMSRGTPMRIVAASAPLRRVPRRGRAARDRGALRRNRVRSIDESARLGLGAARARPVCRVTCPAEALGAPSEPTHRVAALRTHAYPGPQHQAAAAHGALARRAADRSWPTRAISRSRQTGLRLWLASSRGDRRAASRILSRSPSAFSRRPISGAAGRQKGSTARAWFRRRSTAAGVAAPRDSDMQEAALGEPLAIDDRALRSRAAIWCSGRAMSAIMRDLHHAASRQRLSHEGRERAAWREARDPHRRQGRRRGDERKAGGAFSPRLA